MQAVLREGSGGQTRKIAVGQILAQCRPPDWTSLGIFATDPHVATRRDLNSHTRWQKL